MPTIAHATARALQEAAQFPSAVGVGVAVEQPEPLAEGVEAPQHLDVGPGKDQAAVLHAGDAEDAAGLQDALDLEQAVERPVERLEHRMAETGVEVVVGKVESVHVADSELDVLDPVLGCVATCRLEVVLRIDADDVSAGELRGQSERDRALRAPDVENEGAVGEMRKQEVGVDRRAPRLHKASK